MKRIMAGITIGLAMALGAHAKTVVLTPDADADIRSKDQANTAYDKDTLWIAQGSSDPAAARCGKGYIRFRLPPDFGTALNATFTLTRASVGAWNWSYAASGLADGVPGETRWVEKDGTGMTWNGAPGNVATSPDGFTDSTAVGAFTTTGSNYGGTAGDTYAVTGANLIDFLNADANGFVTLMIGRSGVSSSTDLFASKENATYDSPKLTLEYTTNSLVSAELSPVADATIKYASPNSNYGSLATLAIESDVYGEYDPRQKSYLRFQLPAMPGTIVDAKLKLVRDAVAPWQYSVDLYGLKDAVSGQSWSESGITWNNAPGNNPTNNYWDAVHADHLLSKVLNGYNHGGYSGEEVVLENPPWTGNALAEWLNADTDGIVNLMLTTGFTATYQNSFASKESSSYGAPVLVLTYCTDTNAPECNAGFKSPANEEASARWDVWRLAREKFPTAGWDFINTNDYGTNAYQLYADANFSMIRVKEASYQLAVDAGLEVMPGWWETLHQDPAKLAHYMDYPAPGDTNVVGYFLDDEPDVDAAMECGARSMEVYANDTRNAIPMVNHNLPLDELFEYDAPAYLVRTRYTLLTDGSTRPLFYGNLEENRTAGLAYGIGTMGWVQTTRHDSGSTHFRQASESDVYWQVYSILGYGCQGVWYYRYDIDPAGGSFLDAADAPNALYHHVQAANAELHNLWPVFKHLRSVGVFHTLDNPGGGIEGAENLGAGWDVEVYEDGDIGAIETFSGDNFLLGELENQDNAADSAVYVLIQNKRHAMNTASADLAATCSFTVNSNYPYVSYVDPATGRDVYLSPDQGVCTLTLGGGRGILVRLASELPEFPSTISLLPSRDTYVQQGDPTTDFGSSTALIAQNSSQFPDRNRKIYMKYTLPPNGTAADGASLEITPSGIYNSNWFWEYKIHGLKDAAPGNDWTAITWNNAPANDTGSGNAFTADATGPLGTITGGGSAGDTRSAASQALVDFIQADQDGVVTLMMVRSNDSSANDTWASREAVDFPPPQLVLSFSPAVTWTLGYGLDGADAGTAADPDADLASNLHEFAFGGDPTNAALSGHPLEGQLNSGGGSNWVDLVYLRRKDPASGLTYGIEQSTNLIAGVWSPITPPEIGTDDLNESYEFVTNRIEIGGFPAGFLRVQASGE